MANTTRALLLLGLFSAPAPGAALSPDPWAGDERTSVRLLLGSLDGAETATFLRHDGHHYTLGLGASQPVAWKDRLEANLEMWVTERGYGETVTAAGNATDAVTLKAAALVYGARVRSSGPLHLYGVFGVGFQGTRLRARSAGNPTLVFEEDILTPSAHLGFGVEWQKGRDLFALDWRRWHTEGDFSEFDARDVNLGGDYFGIGLGHRW